MMLHVFQPRGTGKTTALIRYAVENGCDILVGSYMMAQSVLETAVYLGVPGPVNSNRKNGLIRIGNIRILTPQDVSFRIGMTFERERPILIDELDLVIEKLVDGRPVAGYSVTYPELEATR